MGTHISLLNGYTSFHTSTPRTSGYLHWGLCDWGKGKDAFHYREDRHAPGDHFIIYPGPNGPLDSIRWEQMRAGLEDYELLWLLTARMKEVKRRLGANAASMDPAEASDAMCRMVVKDNTSYAGPDELMLVRKELQDQILSALQSPLTMLQCIPPAGSKVYYGPWNIIVAGVTERDANVRVNGRAVKVDDAGKFRIQVRSAHKIIVEVTKLGSTKRFVRLFAKGSGTQSGFSWIPDH